MSNTTNGSSNNTKGKPAPLKNPPRAKKTTVKPSPRAPFRQVLEEWMRRPDAKDDEALPEEVTNSYTIEEKEEAYYSYYPAESESNNKEEEEEEDEATKTRDLDKDYVAEEKKRMFGNIKKGAGYEIFDLYALSNEPDELLTKLDGGQELLDPLEPIPDEKFDSIITISLEESMTCVTKLDSSMNIRHKAVLSIESSLTSLCQTGKVLSIEGWKKHMEPLVSHFIEIGRSTRKRTEIVFFVMRNLYLLLLVDHVADSGGTAMYREGAHCYALSMIRVEELIKEREHRAAKK